MWQKAGQIVWQMTLPAIPQPVSSAELFGAVLHGYLAAFLHRYVASHRNCFIADLLLLFPGETISMQEITSPI